MGLLIGFILYVLINWLLWELFRPVRNRTDNVARINARLEAYCDPPVRKRVTRIENGYIYYEWR